KNPISTTEIRGPWHPESTVPARARLFDRGVLDLVLFQLPLVVRFLLFQLPLVRRLLLFQLPLVVRFALFVLGLLLLDLLLVGLLPLFHLLLVRFLFGLLARVQRGVVVGDLLVQDCSCGFFSGRRRHGGRRKLRALGRRSCGLFIKQRLLGAVDSRRRGDPRRESG